MYILRGINFRLIWAFAWKAVLCYVAWSSFLHVQFSEHLAFQKKDVAFA
ncbi:MAG: hypothetical protein ACKVUS_09100 [Saprospiraceae bacterium]